MVYHFIRTHGTQLPAAGDGEPEPTPSRRSLIMRRTAFSIALAAEMFVLTGAARAQPPATPNPPAPPVNPQPAQGTEPKPRELDPAERARMDEEWNGVKKEWEKLTPEQRLLSIIHAKNVEEVELGRLAQGRGTSQGVKDFAAMMVKEHSEGDAKLTSTAATEGVTLWDTARTQRALLLKKVFEKKEGRDGKDGKDRKEHKDKEKSPPPAAPAAPTAPADVDDRKWMPVDHAAWLKGLSGDEFDRGYARTMYMGHSELLSVIEKHRGELTNANVKTFTGEVMGTVRHHRDEVAKLPGAKREPKNDDKPKMEPREKEPAMKDPHWDR
jgi:predicted outer membrane protein